MDKNQIYRPNKQVSQQGFQLLCGKGKPITTEAKINRPFYCDIFQFYPASTLSEGTGRTKNTWKVSSVYVEVVIARSL